MWTWLPPWMKRHYNQPVEEGAWHQTIDARFPQYADIVQRYVCRRRDRYRALTDLNRSLYRTTGIVAIALGVSIPFLSASTFQGSKVTLSVAGLVLAVITAMRSFYNWELRWQIYGSHDLSLTLLVMDWEVRMLEIIRADQEDAVGQAEQVTRELTVQSRNLLESEMSAFWGTISWPDTGNPRIGSKPEP